MSYIPSRKKCDYIVENSKQFFKKHFEFLGKNIDVYHYKQAKFEEFLKFNACKKNNSLTPLNEWVSYPTLKGGASCFTGR